MKLIGEAILDGKNYKGYGYTGLIHSDTDKLHMRDRSPTKSILPKSFHPLHDKVHAK